MPSGRRATLPRTRITNSDRRAFDCLQGFVAAFRGENDLRLAVAVAKIDEQHAAMVAIGIDPAAQGDLLADVFRAQFAASMSPQQVKAPTKKG